MMIQRPDGWITRGVAALTVAAWRLRSLALNVLTRSLQAASIGTRPPPDPGDEGLLCFADTVATWALRANAVDEGWRRQGGGDLGSVR